MHRIPQSRRPQTAQHVDASTARALVEEQLVAADEIVRELFPDADQVVLADPDEPHEPGALRLRHVLDRNGAVLYTASEHDAVADLLETHLIEARDANPDTDHTRPNNPESSRALALRGWSSPADVLQKTYGSDARTPRPGARPRATPNEPGLSAHAPNTRHHVSIDLG